MTEIDLSECSICRIGAEFAKMLHTEKGIEYCESCHKDIDMGFHTGRVQFPECHKPKYIQVGERIAIDIEVNYIIKKEKYDKMLAENKKLKECVELPLKLFGEKGSSRKDIVSVSNEILAKCRQCLKEIATI